MLYFYSNSWCIYILLHEYIKHYKNTFKSNFFTNVLNYKYNPIICNINPEKLKLIILG